MHDRGKLGSGKNAFTRGADLFASVMAAVATFFLGPGLFALTVQIAIRYSDSALGDGWEGLVKPLWWLACVVATFGFCQMAIAISLRLALAKLARILFGN